MMPLVALVLWLGPALQGAPAPAEVIRPRDPWVFRSVLDGRPSIMTIALSDEMWVAYDETTCGLYKAWKGGVEVDGADHATPKGGLYLEGYTESTWEITYKKGPDMVREPVRAEWAGHRLVGTRKVTLFYDLILPSGEKVRVEETPEFVRPMDRFNEEQINNIGLPSKTPGLLRLYHVVDPPPEAKLSVRVRTDGARFKQSLGLERESFEDIEGEDGEVTTRIHSHLVLSEGRKLNYLLMFYEPRALDPAAYLPTNEEGERPPEQPANELTAAEQAEGFELLFDGRTLDGWKGYGRDDVAPGWIVEDGCIVLDDRAGDLVTTGMYADFELRLEWKISPAGNSGIFFHVLDDRDAVWRTGPEMQVLDNDGHADGKSPLTSAGANYALHAPTRDMTRPVGQFNRVRLRVEKGRVTHWLNGVEVVSYALGSTDWEALVAGSKFKSMPEYGRAGRGRIALQDHGDRVWYRNVRIRRFDSD